MRGDEETRVVDLEKVPGWPDVKILYGVRDCHTQGRESEGLSELKLYIS